jgi:hypothetical protein
VGALKARVSAGRHVRSLALKLQLTRLARLSRLGYEMSQQEQFFAPLAVSQRMHAGLLAKNSPAKNGAKGRTLT